MVKSFAPHPHYTVGILRRMHYFTMGNEDFKMELMSFCCRPNHPSSPYGDILHLLVSSMTLHVVSGYSIMGIWPGRTGPPSIKSSPQHASPSSWLNTHDSHQCLYFCHTYLSGSGFRYVIGEESFAAVMQSVCTSACIMSKMMNNELKTIQYELGIQGTRNKENDGPDAHQCRISKERIMLGEILNSATDYAFRAGIVSGICRRELKITGAVMKTEYALLQGSSDLEPL